MCLGQNLLGSKQERERSVVMLLLGLPGASQVSGGTPKSSPTAFLDVFTPQGCASLHPRQVAPTGGNKTLS